MKLLLNVLFIIMVILMAALLASGIKQPTATVTEYRPTKTEESSCSMPMCESLGGHDAIALQVMFGE